MVIGLLTVTLHIPQARSLKDKRMVVRSIKEKVRNNMNVSVAEVGNQDTWQTADLAFVTVGAQADVVQKRLADINHLLDSNPTFWVTLREEQLL